MTALSAAELAEGIKNASESGTFYYLRNNKYIPLTDMDMYWQFFPDLIFLVGFYFAGNQQELIDALGILGYSPDQIYYYLNAQGITLYNYRTEKRQLYQAVIENFSR